MYVSFLSFFMLYSVYNNNNNLPSGLWGTDALDPDVLCGKSVATCRQDERRLRTWIWMGNFTSTTSVQTKQAHGHVSTTLYKGLRQKH